jgi:hypothetical protein
MNGSPVQTASREVPSEAEIETALGYLEAAGYGLAESVHGLAQRHWTFKPGDRWSIAEIVEHLARLEELFVERIAPRLPDAPAGPADRDQNERDAFVRSAVSDRSVRVVVPGRVSLAAAPSQIAPRGEWNPGASMRRFRDCRTRTADFLRTSSSDLRGHVVEHPALGALDGYQWVLFLAAHSVRHTKQILEVKAEPGFPV